MVETASKRAIQNTAEATDDDLIGNKFANRTRRNYLTRNLIN